MGRRKHQQSCCGTKFFQENRRWWRSWTTQQAAWCRPPGASPGARLDSTVADFYIQNIFLGARLVSTLAHFQIQKIFSGAGLGWYLGPALTHATSKISKWFSPKSNLVSSPLLSWDASLLYLILLILRRWQQLTQRENPGSSFSPQLLKWKRNLQNRFRSQHMVVNTEWGAFGDNGELDYVKTKWDEEVIFLEPFDF